MGRIVPPNEEIAAREGWIQAVNSSPSQAAYATVQPGCAAGVARMKLVRLLTDEEATGLVAAMKATYPFVLEVILLADAQVPTEMPGADPEGVSRFWQFCLEHRAMHPRRTYQAEMRKACQPGDVVCAALLVTAAELSAEQGAGLQAAIPLEWPVIEEIETIGLIALPPDGEEAYHSMAFASLRVQTQRPMPPMPPLPPPQE